MDNYEIWNPAGNFLNNLYFYELRDEGRVLTISLKELGTNDKVLKIKFEDVLVYRNTLEMGRLKTTHEIPSFRGFRKTTNSEFLRWFKEESSEIFEIGNTVHYLICNIDNIIDVISSSTVTTEWILEDSKQI